MTKKKDAGPDTVCLVSGGCGSAAAMYMALEEWARKKDGSEFYAVHITLQDNSETIPLLLPVLQMMRDDIASRGGKWVNLHTRKAFTTMLDTRGCWPAADDMYCVKAMREAYSEWARTLPVTPWLVVGLNRGELDRLGLWRAKKRFILTPLIERWLSEKQALHYCREVGLPYAQYYKKYSRAGCSFCPFRPFEDYRMLRIRNVKHYRRIMQLGNECAPGRYNMMGTTKDLDALVLGLREEVCGVKLKERYLETDDT